MWQYGMQLCRLILVNVYDHMWSTGRLLGADDSIPLYSHHTLARVACEGAARIGYLLDPAIGYEHRLLRSAVFALADADARVTAAREVTTHPLLPHAADEPTRRRDELLDLIERAGITIRRNGRQQPTHFEVGAPPVVEPCKTNLTELVKRFYPDRPGTYRSTSGVVHSNPWVLNDTVTSSPFTPELVLEPDVQGIGAATLTTIDASIIVVESYARYYGHDPAPAVRKSRSRAQVIDGLLREWITKPLGR
ncbi:hypothetical protein [Saccharothrix texasensis]|uniref:hypothetical protein n=1 Tax=Saccharothrix texasensis TaxID=103734 RepID=UPI0011CD9453|nr:hypothetical protein [Saccharothrix texasensis]